MNIEDDCFYSVDGTGLVGTYNTGTDSSYSYINNLPTGLKTPINNFPSDFEFKFKFYKVNGAGLLWCIGADTDNCLLVGFDDTLNRMRIYERVNGANSVKQTYEQGFRTNTWTECTITVQNNTCTLTIDANTLSYAITTQINILQTYYHYATTRLTDLKIKSL